jgi:hypothetical protein
MLPSQQEENNMNFDKNGQLIENDPSMVGKFVLWNWNREIYEVMHTKYEGKFLVRNIKDLSVTIQPIGDFILIHNM